MCLLGNRMSISAAKCNIRITDPNCKFDFIKISKEYVLDMSDVFDRSIAIILLHLVAGHPTYVVKSIKHQKASENNNNNSNNNLNNKVNDKTKAKTKGKSMKKIIENIELSVICEERLKESLNEYQLNIINNLTQIKDASENIDLATKLFQQVDVDGSG